MIYDTLFATDESGATKPQMVDRHEVSADKTSWTFTLRAGLEWHDGKPVTAEDCIASLKRWGVRDPMGQKLMDFVAGLTATDDKTFVMKLKEPYGLVLDTLGQQFVLRMNHLTKPFDNLKIRQAALLCIRQEDYLKATVGDPQYYKVCTAAFVCGTPNGVEIQGDLLTKPNFEKSKALLKEAGYDGTPVVLMQSTTLPVLTNMAPVTKALLEQGGFKVDMQSMDWQTLVTRRTNKGPVSQGGWNIFHTFSVAADILNPISTSYMVANGDKAWFGWPNDPEMEKIRDAYAKDTDPVKNKALAVAVQNRALETAQYGWIGQWYGPGAMRSNVSGWLKAPVPVMWNIEKK